MIMRRINLMKEKGQTMTEYAVILAVITVGIVLALGVLSGAIQTSIAKTVSIFP